MEILKIVSKVIRRMICFLRYYFYIFNSLILSGVLIKIRSSKAIIPLALIYIFLYFKSSTEKVEIDSNSDDKN
ncbi:MAG: hypothetical protein CM15mP106_6350 [Candidatus Neomarinimicrobiota bacterium]|nr:MAG: hypothetical protein CM15mP106_6350 [Candidatus Neomarinimicrobiota bacterium]